MNMNNSMSAESLKLGPIAIPAPKTLVNLAIGGVVGLIIWEIWARFITKLVLGYPLEPAGLIDAIAQHQLGLSVPYLLREALHYAVGIFGYPIFYYLVSRNLKSWGLVLDAIVLITFTAGVGSMAIKGQAGFALFAFWIVVLLLISLRYFWRNRAMVDAITWGNFTWFNALGIMAPIGGLSFYILGDAASLSFMSFVGHVIYGAIAVIIFERRQMKM